MQAIVMREIYCPYCGEMIEVMIDCSVAQQQYIEDCQVCCRPIEFKVTLTENDEPDVVVSHENE